MSAQFLQKFLIEPLPNPRLDRERERERETGTTATRWRHTPSLVVFAVHVTGMFLYRCSRHRSDSPSKFSSLEAERERGGGREHPPLQLAVTRTSIHVSDPIRPCRSLAITTVARSASLKSAATTVTLRSSNHRSIWDLLINKGDLSFGLVGYRVLDFGVLFLTLIWRFYDLGVNGGDGG